MSDDKKDSRRTEGGARGREERRPRDDRPRGRRGDERPSRVARIVRERWDSPPREAAPAPRASEAVRSSSPRPDADALIYGVKPVIEVLRARSRPLERILLSDTAADSRLREIIELACSTGTPVRRIKSIEIERIAGAGVNSQGVVAMVAAAHYREADDLLTALAAKKDTADPALAVVLDGVEDPRNLGAIIRTIECAGAHGVFIPERRATGLTDVVAKTAAGAIEYVPVARTVNIAGLLEEMKERGIWTIGTAADAKMNYTEWDWRVPSAIVLGGEGAGLRRLVRERCDALVRIPLLGRIESLNVSVAAAVLLYEAVRQRTVTSDERQDEDKIFD